MREIKFRAWDSCAECGPFDLTDGDSLRYHAENEHVVEQFTGLKDRNGREIYEGDILGIGRCSVPCAVSWRPLVGQWEAISRDQKHSYRGNWFDHHEVIGNIHENPDLLAC